MRGASAGESGPAQSTAPGRPRGPSRMGARNACSSSARRVASMLPTSSAPPSTRTDTTPKSASARSAASTSTRPSAARGTRTTRTPSSRSASSLATAASSPVRISVGISRAVVTSLPPRGVRSCVSNTTRMGLSPGTWRTLRRGSSASTVPMPTATASCSARSSWTFARASSPVTQRDAPVRVAMRPSSDRPSLMPTYGRPRVMNFAQGASSSVAGRCSCITVTSTPSARSRSMPLPGTFGFGSRAPTTTRATPAARMASTHGAVRPVWLQGSSVQ